MPNLKISVVVVWEPILPTDWRKPTTSTLTRISDARVAQFWDPHHLASQEIERSLTATNVAFHGHTSRGNLWDLAVLYPASQQFQNALPAPVFIDGPIVDVAPELQKQLQRLVSASAEKSLLPSPSSALTAASRRAP